MTTPAPAYGRDTDAYLHRLGERVRTLRNQRGMSRKVLAQHAKVSERYLAQLETGKGNGSIVLLRRIARASARRSPNWSTRAPTRRSTAIRPASLDYNVLLNYDERLAASERMADQCLFISNPASTIQGLGSLLRSSPNTGLGCRASISMRRWVLTSFAVA